MTTITTRSGKGSALSFAEVDGNFTNLNTDKIEGVTSSVDGELTLWSSTTGKVLKRASITGIVKATAGVATTATAGTDYAAPGTAQTWTANQTFTSGSLLLKGSASGTGTLNAPAAASSYTWTLPAATATLGYQNVPAVGAKTSSYTLQTADVGKYVEVGSGGSITIPDATFSAGDIVSIFNNTTGAVTCTCSITTAYIAGTDTDKATVSLATRGLATVLFQSGTVCVIAGNVS
jgi:hypothetical protein